MAKTAGWLPAWANSLDAMIEAGALIRVWCWACKKSGDVDLFALRERVGPGYSLLNRRCRCRLTPGCPGWNRFMYLVGVMRHLADDATLARWEAGSAHERAVHQI